MKSKYLIITIITALLTFNSCSDWLDVNPRSEIKETVLLLSESGYKNALNGAYIMMAQSDLYGKNTTMYLPEILSRTWTIPATNTDVMYQLANFDYASSKVESLISTVWLNYFKVIAQLNNILKNFENTDISFSYNNDKFVKGEALGLRAFLHLDILRYFGPVPDENVNSSELAIPYVTEMTKDPDKLVSISYSEVLSNIEKDLNEAERLLEIDPIKVHPNTNLNRPERKQIYPELPDDTWHYYRQVRFNYYAVLATKARFYHWTGKKELAVTYAKKVIEAVNTDNTPKFPLVTEATYSIQPNDGALTMFNEQIFGIHNPDLQSIVNPLFASSTSTLTQTLAYLRTAFETTINANDVRYGTNRYWETRTYSGSRTINHYRKYTGNDLVPTANQAPLIRMAEMYFIVIENVSPAEALPYFSTFRIARALDASIEAPSMADETTVLSRLEKEYRKDFLGEGQMFFFYKKHKYERFTWPANFTLPAIESYVIPKPKGQISFE
jgi:hypothetical protein